MIKLKKVIWLILNLLVIAVFSSSGVVYAQTKTLTEREKRAMGAYFVGGYKLNCSPATSAQPVGAKLASGSSVFILGDSITVRSASSYTSAFKALGITANIDGSSSRSIKGKGIDGNKLPAIDAVATPEDKAFISSASAIIIALGTNGGNSVANMTDLLTAIRGISSQAPIYWVDTTVIGKPETIPSIKASNNAIYSLATAQKFTTISWYRTVTPNGDPLNPSESDTDANKYIEQSDVHVHPTAAGISALTNLVVSSVASTGPNTSNQTAAGCCTTAVSNDASLLGSDNQQKAYNFFVQKGLTPVQSAGIVGNMIAESGVIPKKLQDVYNREVSSAEVDLAATTGKGFGIVQWTPTSKLIKTSLDAGKTYAEIDTLSYQLEQVWGQLNGEGIIGSVNSHKSVGDKLRLTTTVEQSAFLFARYYEIFKNSWAYSDYGVLDRARISRDGISQSEIDRVGRAFTGRIKNAADIIKLYGGGTVGAGGTITSSSSAFGCGQTTPPGQTTRYIDGFTVYSQYDPQWKDKPYGISTIGDAGCGPSAMAMIISTLTGQKVTPVETAAYAAANDQQIPSGGSAWTIGQKLAANWNLKSQKINNDLAEISTSLRTGALIIASGKGAVPFTTGGHFIVIRGLTADGKFKVGDSAHDSSNDTAYDPAQIMALMAAGSIYAITK